MSVNREDAQHDRLMYENWDYALGYAKLTKKSTLKEFTDSLNMLNRYGWDLDANELLEAVC